MTKQQVIDSLKQQTQFAAYIHLKDANEHPSILKQLAKMFYLNVGYTSLYKKRLKSCNTKHTKLVLIPLDYILKGIINHTDNRYLDFYIENIDPEAIKLVMSLKQLKNYLVKYDLTGISFPDYVLELLMKEEL